MNNEMIMQVTDTRNRDRFSWSGILDVAKFWWPVLKWEFWILLGYTVLVSILAVSVEMHILVMLWSLAVTPITYMVMCASSLFGLKSMRERFITLPALNSEKLVFTLLWTFVVVPGISELILNAVFYLHWGEAAYNVLLSTIEIQDNVAAISEGHLTAFKMWSIAMMAGGMITCLYCAEMSRSHNIIKGIGFSILVYCIPSFLIGLMAGLTGFRLGKEGAFDGRVSVEQAMTSLFDTIVIYVNILGVVMLVYFVVMLTLYIKKFAKRQG